MRLVQHGFEVQAILLAQLGGFFLQSRQRLGRLVLEGEHGHVAVGFGGHAQHALFKHLRKPLQEKRVAFVAAPPVGGEDAVFGKGAAAVAEEFGAYEAVDDLFAVEAVNQQDVGAAEQGFDVLRAVGLDDFECFPFNGSSNRPRATAMTFGLISTAVWRQSGRQASIQRANEPPPSPICVMWTGGSANSSQAIIARLYDKTSSVGLSRFIELWMVSLPRWRERMLPVSEMPTSGMAGRAGRRRW